MSDREIKVLIKARRKSQERIMRAFAFPVGTVAIIMSLMWGAM